MLSIEELKEHFKEYEFSDKYIEILKYIRENDNCKISVQGNAGSGKALPLDIIIPTPNGNKRFGDLKVGDYVFDRHGKPTKVIGVFPQGKLDLYKVILADGRETYCNDEHLWTYYTSKGNLKTLTLRDMMNRSLIQKTESKNDNRIKYNSKFKIPTHESVEFNNTQKLPIDPYVIGAFIGNGCNLQKQLTISSNDEFTVKMCADLLGFDYKKNSDKNYSWMFYYKKDDIRKIKNKLSPHADEIFEDFKNELCVKSHLKRIPNIYKYASKEDRFSLIQGLFDTDGTIGKNSRMNISYSSTSLDLIKDIQEVLYSLGYISTIHCCVRKNRILKNQDYRLSVLVDNSEKHNFFRLPRKLERIKNIKKHRRYDRVGIKEVIPMNKKVEMMCIKVDNDEELFLINDYIVTHNTTLLKTIHYMFSDDIDNGRLNVAVASSTGVASALLNNDTDVGATTIHSLFKLKPQDIFGSYHHGNNTSVISEIDVLIIDEISMVSCDLFDYIMDYLKVCRHGKPTRVILFGDCMQLQCVVKDDNDEIKEYYKNQYDGKHAFFSAYAFTREKFITFVLTKIYRQNGDEKFKEVLNRIRVNEQTEEDLKYINQRVINEDEYIMNNESFLRIVSTNKDVLKYNQLALDMIESEYICLKAEITGNFRETLEFRNQLYPEQIYVKIGCPVMITRNGMMNKDGTLEYYNGNIGTLIRYDKINDVATVDLGDKIVNVTKSTTNNYEYEIVNNENERAEVKARITGSYTNVMIKPCSASTVFKCQGLTLNRGYIDFNWWIPDNGIYVALSRFRNISDFGLRKPIQARDIHVNKESLDYVKNAEYYAKLENEMFEK